MPDVKLHQSVSERPRMLKLLKDENDRRLASLSRGQFWRQKTLRFPVYGLQARDKKYIYIKGLEEKEHRLRRKMGL